MSDSEMRDFMLVVRRALLMIVAFIEKRYGRVEFSERSEKGTG